MESLKLVLSEIKKSVSIAPFIMWYCLNAIFEKEDDYRVIMKLYLTNFLFIVLEPQYFYVIVLETVILLYVYLEMLNDQFKNLLFNPIEKLIDCIYRLLFQFAFFQYLVLIIFYKLIYIDFYGNYSSSYQVLCLLILSILFYWSINHLSNQKFVIRKYDNIKSDMDRYLSFKDFRTDSNRFNDLQVDSIIVIEDKNFINRGSRYTFCNMFYFKKVINKFSFKKAKYQIEETNWLRGYSTIEMQMIRTFGLANGFNLVPRRKVFEVIFGNFYFKKLKKYYEKTYNFGKPIDIADFKKYLLIIYVQMADICNVIDSESKVWDVFKKYRSDIYDFTPEELFVLTLTFNGSATTNGYIVDIHMTDILSLGLDEGRIRQLVSSFRMG